MHPAVGVIALSATLAVASAVKIDDLRPPDRVADLRAFYPDAARLRPLCFGYTEVAADLAWIQALIYYGRHIMGDQEFPWLDRMIETAVDLDPRFAGAYRWATSTATWRNRTRGVPSDTALWLANHYAELGMRRLPELWEFPYLLGSSWYYDRDDLPRTRYYWEIAEKMPGADPDLLQRLSDINRRQDDLEKALERLVALSQIITVPDQLEMIRRRIFVLRRKIEKRRQGGSSERPPAQEQR